MCGSENEASFTTVLEEFARTMFLDIEMQLQKLSHEPCDRLARHDEAAIANFLCHVLLSEQLSSRAGHRPATGAL